MARKPISVIIPAKGIEEDDLVLSLLDLDHRLSRCKRGVSEIILSGEEKISLAGLKKLIPELSVLQEGELPESFKGESVLVFKPEGKMSFDNFKKLMGTSMKDADVAVPYSKESNFWISLLNWKSRLLRRILRLEKKVIVVRDSEAAFFKPEAAGPVLFNFPAAVVFAGLSGRRVELVEMPEGNFSPSFSDYLKAWWGMVIFKFEEWRKKRNKGT